LRYPELIKILYEAGFSVFTYDHQSQGKLGSDLVLYLKLRFTLTLGFSGRWLADSQSTWVHSFQDYVDDFVYFATTVTREFPRLPVYLVAHSMGCLIAAFALVRHPSLVSRTVFSSPMFRNKCGMKSLDMRFPVPQLVAHWISYCASRFGLGAMHTLGYFRVSLSELPFRLILSELNEVKFFSFQENPKNPISVKLTKDR
jgi:alpha-beta hydrolase superfamily lysophospholipase